MVQSASSNAETRPPLIPQRTFTVEFLVGIFSLVGVGAGGWLAVGLGGLRLFEGNQYYLNAEFDNVSGLKKGASVEIAGVPVGEVADITLNDPGALVSMRLNKDILIKEDDIFSIRTKGIIGDRFVKISRGGAEEILAPGATVVETESVVDLEDVIGKIVHSMTKDKEDSDDKKKGGTDEEEGTEASSL